VSPGPRRVGFLLVSACLDGELCRWDGALLAAGRRPDWPAAWPRRAVCPEVLFGLGTPRPPVTLVGPRDAPRLRARDGGEDFDGGMRALCAELARRALREGCCGAVLKARSPSCGLGDAERFADGEAFARWGGWPAPAGDPPPGAVFADGWGLLADALRRADPELPLVADEAFADPGARAAFLARCEARRRRVES